MATRCLRRGNEGRRREAGQYLHAVHRQRVRRRVAQRGAERNGDGFERGVKHGAHCPIATSHVVGQRTVAPPARGRARHRQLRQNRGSGSLHQTGNRVGIMSWNDSSYNEPVKGYGGVWTVGTTATQRKTQPDHGLMARIALERSGTPMERAEAVRRKLGMEVSEFSDVLGIKLATYKRKRLNRSALKGSYGYAVSDVEDILASVRDLLPDDKRDFDVARWFAGWIKVPQPALGGQRPEDLLDTPTGRRVVRRIVGAMASGAYL